MNQLLLKFTSHFTDGAYTTFNVSCQSYSSYTNGNGVTYITLYKGMTQTDGVGYAVCSDALYEQVIQDVQIRGGSYYHNCYVENSAGKTINKF